MEVGLIVVLVIFALGALVALAILLDLPIPGLRGGQREVRGNIKNLVATQRNAAARASVSGGAKRESLYDTAEESRVLRKTSSSLTLRKRLKFARWEIPIPLFHAGEIVISACAVSLLSIKFHVAFQVVGLLAGPIFMRWLLNMFVERRFKAFDADYPSFLASTVSLLKTGMNPMAALGAAAQGLEETSLVRQEVELMVERLRFGVSEDKSIGSFAEDVYHPEIELFVQALLLSRRVGGTLSDTLDRLAGQVRKRQYFRAQAVAAVSMQRGSIWFIIGILVCMQLYLMKVFPQAVFGAWADPVGWQVWQGALMMILLGLFWVRQVTKIRI
jgi:tight adherence protein B